jgi:hypothetical protein
MSGSSAVIGATIPEADRIDRIENKKTRKPGAYFSI